MNFFPSLPPPPPPPPSFSTSTNNGMSETNKPQQSYNDNNINANFIGDNSSSSSSSATSVTSSIVIISLIISSAIIISASIYILLRFLSRRSHASNNDVVLHDRSINRSSSNKYTALKSLPVFTFGSVNGNLTGGDCAICLSKFEKEEQLRLLPLCFHAFHTRCIDPWLLNNETCPLCRSSVHPTDTDVVFNKMENLHDENNISRNSGSSFRIEIGSISRRSSGNDGGGRRSYSVGSFEYNVDDVCEIPVDSMNMGGDSNITAEGLDEEVGGSGRNWLREYVDRSFRSSGRFFSGSSRRSDVVVPVDEDLEAINNRAGEEISELFRWISGV